MKVEFEKKFASGLSILSNGCIIILKLFAGIVSGSISVISEAIHSMSDLLASCITYFAIMRSCVPADKEHPFGHGRYEDVAGFVEGILIVLAALYITYEACKKILFRGYAEFDSTLGILVMGASVIANFFVSKYLFFVAKKTESMALKADAEHLRTDIYSAMGVFVGLILIKITGISLLDPIIAIIVAISILKTGISITKESLNNLVDGSLPEEDIKKIENILNECENIYGYKNLKSRKSGPNRSIEITILCEESMTIKDCHNICDVIEDKIKDIFLNTMVIIHCEPYVNANN